MALQVPGAAWNGGEARDPQRRRGERIGPGFVTFSGCALPHPNVSNLNFPAAGARLAAGHDLCAYAYAGAAVDPVVDDTRVIGSSRCGNRLFTRGAYVLGPMTFDLAPARHLPSSPASGSQHTLQATADTCYWGYIDRDQPPCLTVRSGDVIDVEAVTHHAGDAADLLMDDGIRTLWAAIPEGDRGPGVHILTGPIAVEGAQPGDTLIVEIRSMRPRLAFGSNCAAHWGLLYNTFGKERITIYELDGDGATFDATAHPAFGFDFTARPLYDLPGVISPPDLVTRRPFGRPVRIPVRPHFGVIGVAPADPGRFSSIPPGVFGGNVDNWRFGPGAAIAFPVLAPGANLYVGDPHFAQGDGEICGTAIEASLDAQIRITVAAGIDTAAPLLQTGSHWYTHGFGADLDEAMRMAAEQMLWLLRTHLDLSADDAYSLASVAMDLGVTQVVDGTVGCHAGIARSIFA